MLISLLQVLDVLDQAMQDTAESGTLGQDSDTHHNMLSQALCMHFRQAAFDIACMPVTNALHSISNTRCVETLSRWLDHDEESSAASANLCLVGMF